MSIKSFKFEIKGKVQKVFFRKYTQETASKLHVRGWVKNTTEGSVIGIAEGLPDSIASFKKWLRTQGSPSSRIDSATFTEEKSVASFSFTQFSVLRD